MSFDKHFIKHNLEGRTKIRKKNCIIFIIKIDDFSKKEKHFLKVGIFLKSSAWEYVVSIVCTLSSFVHMLCFQLVNYNICCKDTKCAWGNNYFLYWNFDPKNAIFFHRWNECDKIHNSTFSNQNLRIEYDFFSSKSDGKRNQDIP